MCVFLLHVLNLEGKSPAVPQNRGPNQVLLYPVPFFSESDIQCYIFLKHQQDCSCSSNCSYFSGSKGKKRKNPYHPFFYFVCFVLFLFLRSILNVSATNLNVCVYISLLRICLNCKGGIDTEMEPGSLSRFTKLSTLGTFKVSGCQ